MSSALLNEYVAPAPKVTLAASSQQLPLACTTTTDTTDDNLNIADLVHPQYSSPAVEDVSPLVVVSLPPLDEFDAPVYNRIHQEQIVAGMTVQLRVGNPAVQEHVIVQEIPQVSIVGRRQEQFLASAPQVVGSLPLLEEFYALLYDQIHQGQVVAGMATQHRGENPSVQKQVIVQEIPQVTFVERTQEQTVDITGLVNTQLSSTVVEASAPQVVVSLPI